MMIDEHRAILGVGPDATAAEIRAAYRRKAKLAHPDLGGSKEAFLRVHTAVDALLAELKVGRPKPAERPPAPQEENRDSLPGHWMSAGAQLSRAWGLSGQPVTVFAPRKIGLSPFANGARLNAAAYAWLVQRFGPRGVAWDFHIADTVTRVFFRSPDTAREFKLRYP